MLGQSRKTGMVRVAGDAYHDSVSSSAFLSCLLLFPATFSLTPLSVEQRELNSGAKSGRCRFGVRVVESVVEVAGGGWCQW